jgi:hypothetical protein
MKYKSKYFIFVLSSVYLGEEGVFWEAIRRSQSEQPQNKRGKTVSAKMTEEQRAKKEAQDMGS